MQARLPRVFQCLALGLLAIPRVLMAQESWPMGHYPLPKEGDFIGEVKTIEADHEDTLIDIGLRHGIGYNAIRQANPDTRVWLPGEGTDVVVPTRFILPPGPREGVVINIAELRLYYYPSVEESEAPRVETYPIGIGRMDWQTPLGETQITAKVEDPTWYPPQSIIKEYAERGVDLPRAVPPGPDNPLGDFAMILGIPGYLIHGTNRPQGVGMRVSHGCIRMLPEDIEDLIYRVPVGTTVRLINEPFKLGWTPQGTLQAQAYPVPETSPEELSARIEKAFDATTQAANDRKFLIDYARLKQMVENPNGIPQPLLLAEAPFEIPAGSFYDRVELDHALYSQLEASLPEEATNE